jgi:uncharacterized protein YndB with AHSA1/START domain
MHVDQRSDTKTISISAAPARVFRFVADASNLPRWAIGFARGIRRDGDGWVVTTGSGSAVPLRIRSDEGTGVVDFVVAPAPGVEALAASRVIPRGDGTEYVFTQVQPPGMPDEAFARSVAAVSHELVVLRAILETDCPL